MKGYEHLKIKAEDYVQTKQIIKGKVVRIIETGDTDKWGMPIKKAEVNILDGQRIIIALADLEKQK